jgi:short-subunit dehydrogenase
MKTRHPKSGTILITGAAQGIGYSIAKALARKDRILILADLDAEKLTQVVQELDPLCAKVLHYNGDLTDNSVRKKMISDIFTEVDHLDVLINNAGITHKPKRLEYISNQEYTDNFKVNTELPFHLMKAFLPGMQEYNNGIIINISSSANISGYENLSVYSATKSALSALTDSIAAENKDKNIKAIAIMPSRTNTRMQTKVRGKSVAKSSQSPDFVAEVIRKVIDAEIDTSTGDDIRIRNGQFLIEEDIFSKDF